MSDPSAPASLARIERARRETLAFTLLARTHLHRASLTDGVQHHHGRAAIVAHALAEAADGPQRVRIGAELPDMVAFEVTVADRAWRGHRWVRREAGRVVAETVVEEGRARALGRDPAAVADAVAALHPVRPPLGDLRPGEGQFDAGDTPHLPPDTPPGALETLRALHLAVNARDLSAVWALESRPEAAERLTARLVALMAALPDLTLVVERACVAGPAVAVLFHLVGHDHGGLCGRPSGRRARALGSLVHAPALGLDLVIDDVLLAASVRRPLIDL